MVVKHFAALKIKQFLNFPRLQLPFSAYLVFFEKP